MSVDDDLEPRAAATRIAAIAEHAVELPGVDYAIVTVTSGDRDIHIPTAAHPWAERIDAIQRRHREGPSLSSAGQHQAVHVQDLASETRWPKFRAEALDTTPVRSIMGFQLSVDGKSLGALNLFAERPNAFDERTRQPGFRHAAPAVARR